LSAIELQEAESAASPTLSAALDYARRGWPVFPVKGKIPRIDHGFRAATRDEAQIREWWARWPASGIGISTGAGSGVVVLDIDPRNGGETSLEELEKAVGPVPKKTVQAVTGGGGLHIYFASPQEPLRCSAGTLGPGLDFKAEGGYVVAPPSIHDNGMPYFWEGSSEPGMVELAELPAGLLERLRSGHGSKAISPESPGLPIPAGRRDDTLASLAGTMRRRGMGQQAIVAALHVENGLRCKPPLPDSDVERIARSVARYEPAVKPIPNGQAEPEPEGDSELGAPPQRKSPLRSFTVAQLRARPKKVREVIVAPFMGRCESTFLYGPKGHGKTWAALGSATVVAQGNGARFLDFHAPGPGIPTLYVDAEMFEHDIRLRVDDICRTGNLDPGENLFIWTPDAQPDGTPTLNLLDETGRRMLDDHIEDIRNETGKVIEQIYFDNLATLLHGWIEKDSDSWNPVLRWTLQLRARKIGNFWVHHSNRAGGYRGSSAIVTTMHAILKVAHPEGYRASMGAWFDLAYEYTRAKPEDRLIDFNARLEGDVWTVRPNEPDHDELIRILFGQGRSIREIAEQITGMSKSAVERAVKRLKLERTQ
jgi:Bifunctional DNA primase/polymerase, N-terminal/AAA domain/Primase C terminal 1 (PriCT-1)